MVRLPVSEDICDAADAMEAAMLQLPDFQDKADNIKQVTPIVFFCGIVPEAQPYRGVRLRRLSTDGS